jgi:hypothetical protein
MISFARPVLTEDMYIVQKEDFSIICYIPICTLDKRPSLFIRYKPIFSSERMLHKGLKVCRLQLLLVLARAAIIWSECPGTHDHILRFYLRFETSLFVASYDSQGYGGGIRARLHTESESYFTVSDSRHLDGQVPVFIFPRNRVARSYPQAWDPHYIASGRPHRKHRFFYCCVLIHCCRCIYRKVA